MEEEKRKAKVIADQLRKGLVKLAKKTDEEIQQMADDYAESMKSTVGRSPKLLESLGVYDHMIIVFIQTLLGRRTEKRQKRLKKNIVAKEEE